MIGTSNILPFAVSPDGQVAAQDSRTFGSLKVYRSGDGQPALVCPTCSTPQGTAPLPPDMSWSADGKYLYLKFEGSTFSIALTPGKMLPAIPPWGIESRSALAAFPGARLVSDERNVFPGPNPSIYAFTQVTTQRNIYRVAIR